MPIYDYVCNSCTKKFEKLVPMAEREKQQDCPNCDGPSFAIVSPTRCSLDGTDPGFPGAYDKWARQHEKAGQ